MEQRKRPAYKSCKFCNYCKHFESNPSGTGDGVCNYSGMSPTEAALKGLLFDAVGMVVKFYDRGCPGGFEHTIHNHYGLPSPDYVKDYKNALNARVELAWDVYEHTHKPDPTIYTFI